MKRGACEFSATSTAKEIGAILTSGIAAGLDSEAGGGADWIGGVAIGEF